MPTPEQLEANRLNPTANTIYTPSNGIFTDGREALFLQGPTGLTQFRLVDLLSPQEKSSLANYGAQLSAAQQKLQSQYGLNLSSLPTVQMGEYWQNAAGNSLFGKLPGSDTTTYQNRFTSTGTIDQFLNAAPSSLSGTQVNTQPNQLAPNQDITLSGMAAQLQTAFGQNDFAVLPNETPEAYAQRTAKMSPAYQAPTTTPTAPATISSDVMTGGTPINYKTYDEASMFALSPAEVAYKKALTDLESLNTQYAGLENDSEYKAANQRVKQLATEGKQIPLQIQENFEGRGVTKAGLQPIEMGALRTNTIQLLGASTALQSILDSKFKPLETQIKLAQDNLQLKLQDPAITVAEKKRAQLQLDFQNQKAQALAQQKTADERKWEIFIEASQNGADELTKLKIMKATSPEAALIAAGNFIQQKSKEVAPKIIGSAATGYFTVDSNNNVTPLNLSGPSSIPTYEQFYKDFLATPEGKSLAAQYGGDNIALSKALHDLYDKTSQEVTSASSSKSSDDIDFESL